MLNSLLLIEARDQDSLTLRRSRALALLLVALASISIVFGLLNVIVSSTLQPLLNAIFGLILYGVIYTINRSGRLQIAVTILLAGQTIFPFVAAFFSRSPTPSVFFFSLIVVVAVAFGRPRDPLIWAGVLTFAPFVMNMLLYRSLLPPASLSAAPAGANPLPLLTIEILALLLLWLTAGASYLTAYLLQQTLEESRAATHSAAEAQQALVVERQLLEVRVAERTAELEQALVALRESSNAREQLSETVRELSIPVLPVLKGVLVVPMVGTIDQDRATLLLQSLLQAVERHRARTVILDVTGVPLIDSHVARLLLDAAGAVRLLGAETVLVGLRPELAQTIVGLGMDLTSLVTQADLQSGISYSLQQRT